MQGFDWEPAPTGCASTEFGPDSDDEVNLIREGGNYGWPDAQGDEGAPEFEEPRRELRGRDRAVGRHVRDRAGLGLDRRLPVRRAARRAAPPRDGRRQRRDEALFEGDFGRLRTVIEGPDGALYVLTNNTDGRGSPREGDDRVVRIVPPRR